MKPKLKVSLKPYNTLSLDVKADYFVRIHNINDLHLARNFCQMNDCPWLLIGGGSNLVLTQDFEGLVMLMAMDKVFWPSNITVPKMSDKFALSAEAGYEWDRLVEETIQKGASGLENLSLIPGQVGAAPIQNIGAYGVELAHCLTSVDVFDFKTGQTFQLTTTECKLGYRDSIFKTHPHWIVTQVNLTLNFEHEPQVGYGIIADTIASISGQSITDPSPQQIRDAVIHIRRTKLPDPKYIPNVGSFFKNPVVTSEQVESLTQIWPGLVSYPLALIPVAKTSKTHSSYHKLAAGWLIDKLGWKGFREGGVGVHEHQALVLVCSGSAKGKDVLDLALRIQADVKANFGVKLEIEPRLFDSRGEFTYNLD